MLSSCLAVLKVVNYRKYYFTSGDSIFLVLDTTGKHHFCRRSNYKEKATIVVWFSFFMWVKMNRFTGLVFPLVNTTIFFFWFLRFMWIFSCEKNHFTLGHWNKSQASQWGKFCCQRKAAISMLESLPKDRKREKLKVCKRWAMELARCEMMLNPVILNNIFSYRLKKQVGQQSNDLAKSSWIFTCFNWVVINMAGDFDVSRGPRTRKPDLPNYNGIKNQPEMLIKR